MFAPPPHPSSHLGWRGGVVPSPCVKNPESAAEKKPSNATQHVVYARINHL